MSSQGTFYAVGLLAIVGSLFFFFGASSGDGSIHGNGGHDGDVVDIGDGEEDDQEIREPLQEGLVTPREVKQYSSVPSLALKPGVDYNAVIEMEAGRFVIDLLEAETPDTWPTSSSWRGTVSSMGRASSASCRDSWHRPEIRQTLEPAVPVLPRG